MKAVVFIWSYLVFIPLLTPFAILPVFWLLRKVFISASEHVNAAFLMFVFLGLMGWGTYFNFTQGLDAYARFLDRRGVETEATVVNVIQKQNLLANATVNEIEILFRDSASRTFKLKYDADERRLYPPVPDVVLPKSGEKVQIRYFPSVETGFIILTDSAKSEYGGKIVCQTLEANLKKAETKYKFPDTPTPDLKATYREAINAIVESNCLGLNERAQYRDILPTLK